MIEKNVPTIAKNERPIIVWRIWRPGQPLVLAAEAPDLVALTPERLRQQDAADRQCLLGHRRQIGERPLGVRGHLRRAFPTFAVSQMKNGSMNRDRTVSGTDRISIATSVLAITTTFDRIDDAVSVTTDWTPPMSFASRDWISPVRVW